MDVRFRSMSPLTVRIGTRFATSGCGRQPRFPMFAESGFWKNQALAAKGSLRARMKRIPSPWHQFGIEAELAQPFEQAVDGFVAIDAVEVGGAEIVPVGLVAQHVPGGGEHRGGHGEDGLLGAAPSAQAVELRLEIAAVHTHGSPGALHEGGLEPVAAVAQAGAAALAGTLIVTRTQSGPGDEMAGGLEARHVHADLGHDHAGADGAQTWHGTQVLGGFSKRLEPEAHLLLDRGDSLVQGIDLAEVKLQHEAVMRADASAQGFEQLSAVRLDTGVDAAKQMLRVGVAVDDRLEHRATALAQDVAQHEAELEIGVLEHLLDALDVGGTLAHELLAGTGE